MAISPTSPPRENRYEPEHILTRSAGIGADRPLDFHSPYGCSKGPPTNMCSITRALMASRPWCSV